jgi:hypothetical protein
MEILGLHGLQMDTHTANSFYENLPADEAFALAQRLEFNYTPSKPPETK